MNFKFLTGYIAFCTFMAVMAFLSIPNVHAHSIQPGIQSVRAINGFTKVRITAINRYTVPKSFVMEFFEDSDQQIPITEGIQVRPRKFNLEPSGRRNLNIGIRTDLDKVYICSIRRQLTWPVLDN